MGKFYNPASFFLTTLKPDNPWNCVTLQPGILVVLWEILEVRWLCGTNISIKVLKVLFITLFIKADNAIPLVTFSETENL